MSDTCVEHSDEAPKIAAGVFWLALGGFNTLWEQEELEQSMKRVHSAMQSEKQIQSLRHEISSHPAKPEAV